MSVFDGEVSDSRTLSNDLVVKRSRTALRAGPGPISELQLTGRGRAPGAASTIAIDSRYYPAAAAKRNRVF